MRPRLLLIPTLVGATTIAAVQSSTAQHADFVVAVGKGYVRAPDHAGPGWTRMRVEEDGAGHIAVVFRVQAGLSDSAIAVLRAVLDTAAGSPRGVKALGGPEVGDTGEVIVHLTPGRYLLGCVRRGADGHRHLAGGEWKTFLVRPGAPDVAHAKPPAARHTVRMVDFAFIGDETWIAGPQVLRVENTGTQDHQLRIVKLRPGATMKDWINAPNPGAFAQPVAGLSRTSAGETSYLPLDLGAGSYVAHCLVTDPKTGKEHIFLGMYRLIVIP